MIEMTFQTDGPGPIFERGLHECLAETQRKRAHTPALEVFLEAAEPLGVVRQGGGQGSQHDNGVLPCEVVLTCRRGGRGGLPLEK